MVSGRSKSSAWEKVYFENKKRRDKCKELGIECEVEKIRLKQLNKDFDESFNTFGKYLGKFHSYVSFKQKHPYAEIHPDFEHEVTPVTILDNEKNEMKYYLPDCDSRSAQILSKFRNVQVKNREALLARRINT